MKEIRKKLSALLTDAGKSAEYAYSGGDCDITGITDDTRSLSEGCIFICVKGARFDGHTAAAEMLEKGAAAVVCDHDLGLGDRQIVVSDTRKFYGHLTAAWFDHPEKQLTLIGITGTNGKTTLATMVLIFFHTQAKRQVLSAPQVRLSVTSLLKGTIPPPPLPRYMSFTTYSE